MNNERLKKHMQKCPLFLYKISHESQKEQNSRLTVSSQFQRRTLLRVLYKISKGKIPMSSDTYIVLKSKKKATALTKLGNDDNFQSVLMGTKVQQIAELKKYLPVLKNLLRPLFYKS